MTTWQPSASINQLLKRAHILTQTRHFFLSDHVIEVQVPCIQGAPNSDLNITSFSLDGNQGYLTTSPEHFLKRLLCAGHPDCYSLGPSFRGDEFGQNHNPEFTMLEWYRRNFKLDDLIANTIDLFNLICGARDVHHYRYRELFNQHCAIDPCRASDEEIDALLSTDELHARHCQQDALDMLMMRVIEPQFNPQAWTVVSGYPSNQAAQAELTAEPDGTLVAARFEIYGNGLELANGYQECSDATEMARRMASCSAGPLDQRYLAALEKGLPPCAGVAVGFDRLCMVATGCQDIAEVMSFRYEKPE